MIFVLNTDEKVVAVLNNDSPEACPYWNDEHTENLHDSDSRYEFEAPLQHESSRHLIAENFIARADIDGDYLLFKIKTVDERLDTNGIYVKKIYAKNAAIDELRGAIIRPKVMVGWTAEATLNYLLMDTKWELGICEYLGAKTFEYNGYPTALAAIQEVASKYEGEFRYRITLNRNRISGRFIDFVDQRGTDTGKRFEYRKDIRGLQRTEDSRDLVTALIGLGAADTKGKRLTFASINGGLDWVGDDDSLDRWSKDGRHIFGVYEDDNAQNPTDLLARTRSELNRRKNPLLTYEVDVLLLESLAEWSHEAVRLGDNVKVLDLTFTPELVLGARIIELTRSYNDPTRDKAVLGEFVPLVLTVPSFVREMQKNLVANTGILGGKDTVAKGKTAPAVHQHTWEYDDLSQSWE